MKLFSKSLGLLTFFFVIICSCNQKAEYELPTFKPVEYNENLVFVENPMMSTRRTEIIVIDTLNNKTIYTYPFGRGFFYNTICFNPPSDIYLTVT